jgi:hypothetical protein
MVRAVRPLRSLSLARGCARIDSRFDTAKNRLSRSRRGPSRPVACSYGGMKNVSTRPGHVTDMPKYLSNVRYWENSGRHVLALSFSGFDPNAT